MDLVTGLRNRWQALSPRERTLTSWALAVVAVGLIWALGFKPALSTLRAAPEQRAQAQAVLDRLQGLAAQADALRGATTLGAAQNAAVRTMESGLDEATKALVAGALGDGARLESQGRFVTVSFEGVSGGQLRQALQTLRARLRAQLIEAELAPDEGGIRGRLRFEWTNG